MRKFISLSFYIVFVISSLNSCSSLRDTAKLELTDGYYWKKTLSGKSKVYVDVTDEDIRVYKTYKRENSLFIDTTQAFDRYLPEIKSGEKIDFVLSKNSLDVDFLTIPIKFRFSEKETPAQLNANINGALYLGFRTDNYQIKYPKNPLKMAVQKTDHFGYSVGLFSGFGNTLVSPTNTQNILDSEYDGIVWSKGIAAIVGVNNFTVGLTFGFDNLLDKNKKFWLYENKPWIGLGFGLNLN